MNDESKKLSKQDLLKAFKADISSADSLRLEVVASIEKWRKEYNGEPYGNEQKGKSSLVSRDIKRQDEWQHASVKDPFVSTADIVKCNPVTFEDRAAAEQNQIILNNQFARQFPRYQFITDVIKLHYSEGTVVVKTGWNYEDEKEKVMMPIMGLVDGIPQQVGEQEIEQIKILVNQPDATICRLEDIYIDPTCFGDLKKANFVSHRFESDMSTLRKAGKYKNLKKLAMSMLEGESPDYDPEDDTEFRFQDVARKKVLVYEYWGVYDIENTGIAEPIVATWVGDTLIQLESNPMPGQGLPFLLLKNNPTPFKIHGEASVELISDNQKITTAIKRGILDNMAGSNNAQKGVRKGALDTRNMKRFLNGSNFEYNGAQNDFYEGSYNQIPNSVFSVLEMVNNESESMLGIKAFSGGISGAGLGSTATSARGALDAVSVRRLDIVRNIAENLIKPLMRKWMEYNSEFLKEEEVVRMTNDEFVPIKRDDLKGLVDIEIEVSTAEDNSAKGQELSFLLQTLGQGMDTGMKNLLMSQIAKLHKMPDLAKQLEEYQPQPDPYIEKMKELEMQKLISEIEERNSRARENAVDIQVKSAKALLDQAKAGNIQSDTDLKDLDFTRTADGKVFQEEMQKKDHDRTSSLAGKQSDRESKREIEYVKQLTKQ
jgi:hypothetical protein